MYLKGGDFGQREKKTPYNSKNEPKNVTKACIKNEKWETGNSSGKALPFTVYSVGADFSYSKVRTGYSFQNSVVEFGPQ